MKIIKIISCSLLISFLYHFLFNSSLVFANDEHPIWEKYSSNPIVSHGQNNSWNRQFVRSVSVIKNDNYKMWFDGFDGSTFKIGFATSSNGIDWEQFASGPILNGAQKNENYVEPHVLFDDGKYKMWFLALHKSNGSSSIKYSESNDGIVWSDPITSVIPTQNWEAEMIAHPHVIKVGNQYRLYYSGFKNGAWSIGYATSLDGISWDKHSNNPIFTPNSSEPMTVAGQSIIYINSKYYMYYHNHHPANQVSLATSTDGINWDRIGPVLTTTHNGFDRSGIISPFILKDDNELKMYYSGFDGNRWAVGLATSELDNPSVPLLKQTEDPWQDDVYDSANLWSPGSLTINRWGCSITSAAMVLQYYGYTKLPSGEALDPGSLNSWLRKQSDGYVGNGLLNWIALSRLSKLARSINNIDEFDALEFSRLGKNQTVLENDLSNNHPVILSQPGHFIVATEKLQNTIAINDPYYARSTLNDGYNNSHLALYRFIPSNTDLSYIMLVLPKDIEADILDESGTIVSESYIEPALSAPDDPTVTSGKDTRIVIVQKPETAHYTLRIKTSNPQLFIAQIFLYDVNGDVITKDISGMADSAFDTYTISYNKETNQNSYIKKVVTYKSLLSDLKHAYKLKLIKKSAYKPLESLIKNSEQDSKRKRHLPEKIRLQTTLQLTSNAFRYFITDSYEKILKQDLKTLISSL